MTGLASNMRVAMLSTGHHLEIEARAKMPAGAGQHCNMKRRIGSEIGKGTECVGGIRIDGVTAGRPVDRDGTDRAVIDDHHAHITGIARSTIARISTAASNAP